MPRAAPSTIPKSLLRALAIASLACAPTHLPPLEATSGGPVLERDERRLWDDAATLEKQLDESGLIYSDSGLTAYVDAVAGRLLATAHEGAGAAPRIRIVRDPLLNAFALPQGAIYLHTGMLARMDGEAQLATVLAHELSHVTRRHALRELRSARNRRTLADVLAGVTILAGSAALGPNSGGSLAEMSASVSALWTLSAINGYSRELETEADELGLDWVIRAGYDPRQAPKVFEHLLRDFDDSGAQEAYFYGTHPRLQDRIANYRRLLHDRYGDGAPGADSTLIDERYSTAMGPLFLDNAELDLRIGRVSSAEAAVARHLARSPQSARGHQLQGEIARRRDRVSEAIAEYETAARLDPGYAEPHRELGLIYRRRGCHEDARREFERYLSLKPTATDAPVIRWYLGRP
jgi:predicted Zn-dependent protease